MSSHGNRPPTSTAAGRAEAVEEIFKRIKIDALVTLILQGEQLNIEHQLVQDALDKNSGENSKNGRAVSRDTIHGIITGQGERDKDLRAPTSQQVSDESPFVLLDVRLADDFVRGHIISAVSYPHTNLSRNFATPAMLKLKNKPGKLIIVYDDQERHAPRVASTLLQRGYDNVIVLSGGLLHAQHRYPRSLITGVFDVIDPTTQRPIECDSETSKSSKKSKPDIAAVQNAFTEEDLEILRGRLQHNLLPKISKGRLVKETTATTNRRKAVQSDKQSKKNDKPWK